MTLEKFPFIVVDQNQIRDQQSLQRSAAKCRNEGLQFLIPEGSFFEMSKSTEHLDTWCRSLSPLIPHRDIVCVSRKLTEMIREELQQLEPCHDIVFHDGTKWLRAVLNQLHNCDEGELRRMIDGPVANLMPASQLAWSNHEKNKQLIVSIHDEIKRSIGDQQLKDLRRDPTTSLSTWLNSDVGMNYISHQQSNLQFTRGISIAFAATLVALAIRWLSFGGIGAAKPEVITNDLHDLEYIVLGSLCAGLLSVDKRSKAICEAVTAAMQRRLTMA